MENLKFVWNGIRVNGKLYRAWYSQGNLIDKYPKETITIYARDYDPLPRIEGLTVQNDSDIYTDYFEKDRIRILPDNKFFPQVSSALALLKIHTDKRIEKKYGKGEVQP